MSNRKKTAASFPPMVGGSSLLVIFAVLGIWVQARRYREVRL